MALRASRPHVATLCRLSSGIWFARRRERGRALDHRFLVAAGHSVPTSKPRDRRVDPRELFASGAERDESNFRCRGPSRVLCRVRLLTVNGRRATRTGYSCRGRIVACCSRDVGERRVPFDRADVVRWLLPRTMRWASSRHACPPNRIGLSGDVPPRVGGRYRRGGGLWHPTAQRGEHTAKRTRRSESHSVPHITRHGQCTRLLVRRQAYPS